MNKLFISTEEFIETVDDTKILSVINDNEKELDILDRGFKHHH